MINSSIAYCSNVYKLEPFQSKEAALAWQTKYPVDTSSTPILLPFFNKNKNIEFLTPRDPDDTLRVIGAGNPERKANFLTRIYRYSISKLMGIALAPHMSDIEGDIPIEKNGFIVVYEKDSASPRSAQSIGNKFAELYANARKELLEQIKTTDTNDKPRVNESKFTENLSKLAIELNIVAGICYFIYKEEDGTESVYRHIFKEGVANRKIGDYLAKEKESAKNGQKIAAPVQIQNNKTIKTHRIAFIKDLFTKLSFLLFTTAIIAATAAGAITFLPLTAALSVTGITSFMLLAGIPYLYKKASLKNQATVEFADTFEVKPLSALSKVAKFFSIRHKNAVVVKGNTPIIAIGDDNTAPKGNESIPPVSHPARIEANIPANDATARFLNNHFVPLQEVDAGSFLISHITAPVYAVTESISNHVTTPLYNAAGSFFKGVTAATTYFFSKPVNPPGVENTPASDPSSSRESTLVAPATLN